MIYRSTQASYVHYSGSVIAGVEYGSGIELVPNSSGNAATIIAVGDEDNKDLRIAGKGTGGVFIGSSTNALGTFLRYTVQFTEPDAPASTIVYSTYTVAGATTNAAYTFSPRMPLALGYAIGSVRVSTANELVIGWVNATTSTRSGSSNRGTLLQIG